MLRIEDVDLTPNPQALKFILNEKLLEFETRNFASKSEAENDPMAKGIFEIEGVVSVFYMDNFVTVEKGKDVNWGAIQKPLVKFIESFDKNLIPKEVITEEQIEEAGSLLQKINEELDLRVRPALAGDGGGLRVVGLSGKTVKIHYQGACGSCPTAISGTLRAIENLLQRNVDPSIQVIAD